MSEQGTNQIQQLQVPPAQDFDTANFQGSMQEVLHENIGNYVLVDFLIGTSNLVTRQGFLYYVGTQFIVLYDSLNLRYVVCDIFSIKFVTFLLPGYQPGQIQTTAEFEMHPGTPNTQVVSEMTPCHDARAGCPRPRHPPEESDRAIIVPHENEISVKKPGAATPLRQSPRYPASAPWSVCFLPPRPLRRRRFFC